MSEENGGGGAVWWVLGAVVVGAYFFADGSDREVVRDASISSGRTASDYLDAVEDPVESSAPDNERTDVIGEGHESNPGDGAGVWVCGLSVTFNDDWHDDVLCTNGVDEERPYLLPDQSFITEADQVRAGLEYADYLNSQ